MEKENKEGFIENLTMEMISVSKMKKAVALAQASKEYAVAVFSLISYIARQNDIRASSFLFAKSKARSPNTLFLSLEEREIHTDNAVFALRDFMRSHGLQQETLKHAGYGH